RHRHGRDEDGRSILLRRTASDPQRTTERHELRILLDIRDKVEHIGGAVTDPAFRGKLGHQRLEELASRRAARRRAKSSPAWCDERVRGLAETIRNPLA